jgi:hypothetical protein
MRRIFPVVFGLAMAGCATAPSQPEPAKATAAPETFQARLDPRSEVPAPNLDGAAPSGPANFTVNGTTVVYKLSASGLSSAPLMAHIHLGAAGAAGPVIVPLSIAAGASAGTAAGEGTFDATAVKGKKADGSAMTLDDVLAAMRAGGTYVNVHTANNKPGEVRGQIEK